MQLHAIPSGPIIATREQRSVLPHILKSTAYTPAFMEKEGRAACSVCLKLERY